MATTGRRRPDDATTDYLHRYFEPTARAIDGLEAALPGISLLDHTLALDLRKPQDYFHRVWTTAFRAADLADTMSTAPDESKNTGRRPNRKHADDRALPTSTVHRPPPWRRDTARPKPLSAVSATPSRVCAERNPGQRRRGGSPSGRVENVPLHRSGRENRSR
jgi:hypothetical protein